MTKCSDCRFGEMCRESQDAPWEYYCLAFGEFIDKKSAECEELPCDAYVPDDRYDDTA